MNIHDFQHDGPDHGHPDACILCEKRITNFDTASMVEFDMDGEILGPDSPESNGPESMGEHLIGPSCKRRLIKAGADPKWFRPGYEVTFSGFD
jgi:hypothetical protein